MEPLNILHTSDLHLDHVLSEYSREVRAVRRRELIDTFNFLVSEAIRLNVRLLLMPGDLMCTNSVADSTVEALRDGFARLGRNSIFVAVTPGDAEEEGGLELLRDACSGENVHLFLGEEWSSISPFPGITLWGLRTTARNSNIRVLSSLLVEGSGMHIGLMHGTFAGTPVDSGICPISPEALSQSGLDYLALGHYHNMVNCSVGRATCWYSGSPVHLNFDTRGERHALLVSLREDGVRIKPIKVPSRPHRVITIDIAGKSGPEIHERLNDMANSDLCLRVELEGRVDAALRPVLARLDREFRGRFFHLEVTDRTDLPVGAQRSQERKKHGRHGSRRKARIAGTGMTAKTAHSESQDSGAGSDKNLRDAERDFLAKLMEGLEPVVKASIGEDKHSDEVDGPARPGVSEGAKGGDTLNGGADSGEKNGPRSSCPAGYSEEVVNRAIALGLSVLGEVFRRDDREAAGFGQKGRSDT